METETETTEAFNLAMAEQAKLLEESIRESGEHKTPWDALVPKSWLPGTGDYPLDANLAGIDAPSPVVVPKPEHPEGTFLRFKKRMRNYHLQSAHIKSVNIEVAVAADPAALEKVVGNLHIFRSAFKWAWERRHSEAFEAATDNLVVCSEGGEVPITTGWFGSEVSSVTPKTTTGYIENSATDYIHKRLVRTTDHSKAYGMVDKTPIFALYIGPDASDALHRECGVTEGEKDSTEMDEKVRSIHPSGKSFGGFYHLINYLPPRYSEQKGKLVRVEPFGPEGNHNASYDTAEFEVAYVIHKTVMEIQVPKFPKVEDVALAPDDYFADIQWLNLFDPETNPLRKIGVFYAGMHSAAKPLLPNNGYTILFRRDTAIQAK